MKKLFTILSFVLLVGISFWTSIELKQTISIEQNIWSTNIPTITIDFTWDTQESFSINLSNDKLIFLDAYSGDLIYTLSDNHKKITFDNNDNNIVTLDGLKIRTYDDTVDNAHIGLDIDNDSVSDYSTTRYITVTDDENTDNTKPLPVKDLDYTINNKDIILSWTKSPSLDTVRQVVRIYKNWNYYMDKYLTAGDETITLKNYYTSNDTYAIEVYAKDQYYAWETTTINIEVEEQPKEDIKEVDKYIPSSDNYVITTIATYIDNLIDERYTDISSEKNNAITYRNQFIETSEKFIDKTISSSQAKIEFVSVLWKLMPLIK